MFEKIHQKYLKLKKGLSYLSQLPTVMSGLNKRLDDISGLNKRLDDIFYNMQVLSMLQNFHAPVFPQFKGVHEGERIVIVASGPSARRYKRMPNALHLAINFSFYRSDIEFDYMFVNDCSIEDKQNNRYFDKRIENTKKFFGMIPKKRLSQLSRLQNMQPRLLNMPNTYAYLLEDVLCNKFATHLECEPFGDFCGTVFSALQFVLYTKPAQIYLVGCDCTHSSHFYDSSYTNDYSPMYNSFIKFSDFAKATYPDIQIYSINPVRLKGLFNDVYM